MYRRTDGLFLEILFWIVKPETQILKEHKFCPFSRPTISSCLKIICGHDHLIRVQNCHFFLHSLFIFYDILMFIRKLHDNQFDRNISGFVSEHWTSLEALWLVWDFYLVNSSIFNWQFKTTYVYTFFAENCRV